MARDSDDSTPIENRAELIEWIAAGEKPVEDFRIGTEHEKFPFYTQDLAPVPYEGDRGIKAVLDGLAGLLGWEPIIDDGRIIGLVEPTGAGAISLEPGGQFELSGAPLLSLHQTCGEVHSHLAQLREISEPLGIRYLGVGMSPVWSLDETPRMPKSRYGIMSRYMPKVGTRGLDMMYRTTTIQVNLDFKTEADMVRKMRVGQALQSVATAIFASSPFSGSKPNGFLSERAEIWRDVDNNRSGLKPDAYDAGFGYEAYVDWALDVPMYFVKRGSTYHDVAGASFRDLLAGNLPQLPGEKATLSDWTNHLSTLFPDVRLKRFLEMRGADGGPWRRICALPAFWVGLLYDDEALDAAWDLVKDWTLEERQTLRDTVPLTGMKTPFRAGTVQDVAREAARIARLGLKNRKMLNKMGDDETHFIEAVEETVITGKCPASRMLDRYHWEWGGDIKRVYEDYAY